MQIKPLLAAVLLLGAGAAWADVPDRINFQGKLLDTNKNPRNGSYSITFRICDTPSGSCASPIWAETQASVSVVNGVFNVQLGAVTPLSADVFADPARYLEIQIGAEVGAQRERLMTSPYAFRASVADDVASGDSDYIQSSDTLQTGATFYVSSGTVSNGFRVGGLITAGTSSYAITNTFGNLDATKLSGALPDASFTGTYTKPIVLSSNTNSFTGIFIGDGLGLSSVTATSLVPGNTNYIQNRLTVQPGAAGFYVSSATVGGSFTATGTVQLGGVAGTNDVVVRSSLTVQGDLKVAGNDISDSSGANRLTLGSNIVVNGNLQGASGNYGLQIGTAVVFTGSSGGDNYIAYPMTAGADITARNTLYVAGANDVRPVAAGSPTTIIGVAANSVSSGGTVYVITSGIVTGVVANAAITAGTRICGANSTGAGRAATCTTDGAVIGKALTGAGAAGSTFTLLVGYGN